MGVCYGGDALDIILEECIDGAEIYIYLHSLRTSTCP
jgi:hypothetical protein